MKKLNITKERFEKSRYFQKKYGKLEYVSESGKMFKTSKGKVLKFVKENVDEPDNSLTCPNCSGNDIYVDAGYATCGDCDYSWELKDYTTDKYSKEYDESKKFGKKFNEDVHSHETDEDVPVTEQEKMLCDYIADEIEGELNEEMGLELTCSCNWHNPGEEQHIEIFVGIPEGDDQIDPKYENIETFLEQFVNKIGGEEYEGEKWGDASFQWISD